MFKRFVTAIARIDEGDADMSLFRALASSVYSLSENFGRQNFHLVRSELLADTTSGPSGERDVTESLYA